MQSRRPRHVSFCSIASVLGLILHCNVRFAVAAERHEVELAYRLTIETLDALEDLAQFDLGKATAALRKKGRASCGGSAAQDLAVIVANARDRAKEFLQKCVSSSSSAISSRASKEKAAK